MKSYLILAIGFIMQIKQSIGVRFFIGILLSLASISCAAETSLWRVAYNGNQVFIGGTIHMLKPSDYPLPKEYASAFNESNVVYFETDMGAVQDPAFGMKMAQKMMLTGGKTLQTSLSMSTWKKLQDYATKVAFPLAQMQTFEPAFVGLMLSVLEMQKLGFSEGIDAFYYKEAKENNKSLGALETPDEQLEFMVSMTKVDPNVFILSTLQDLDNLPKIMESTVSAWRRGDLDELDNLLGEPMRKDVPALYNVILKQRNKAWIKEIEALLKTPEKELILVGAMHLAGPDSVLSMLKAKGMSITRY